MRLCFCPCKAEMSLGRSLSVGYSQLVWWNEGCLLGAEHFRACVGMHCSTLRRGGAHWKQISWIDLPLWWPSGQKWNYCFVVLFLLLLSLLLLFNIIVVIIIISKICFTVALVNDMCLCSNVTALKHFFGFCWISLCKTGQSWYRYLSADVYIQHFAFLFFSYYVPYIRKKPISWTKATQCLSLSPFMLLIRF